MHERASISRVILSLSLYLLAAGIVRGEISVDPPNGSTPFVNTLILGTIVDSPDPIGQATWQPFRPAASILNPGGYAREDGRPHLVWKQNSWPVVVWAHNLGNEHDIAIAEWDGSMWTATEFLTGSTDNEVDPRVFVEPDGTVQVVWWVSGTTDEVYVRTRPPGTTLWNAPVLVTLGAETGRRPSVVADGGVLLVAYERDSVQPGMAQDIVVATDTGGGNFTTERVASTARTDLLDPVIHAEGGKAWVDWMHDVQDFGCIEKKLSGWSAPVTEPWTDQSWVGVETMRRLLREQVLSD